MKFDTLKLNETFDGQVIELTLSMPPANILSLAMIREISLFLQQQRNNNRLKLVVFRGEGENFCFGASVQEHTPDVVRDMLPAFHALIGEMLEYPIATLAQVSGFCLGGGFELALASSFIFADDTAKFSVPEIRLGVFPPAAAVLLPYLGNSSLAVRMIITGSTLNAVELKEAGIVALVANKESLQETVDTFIAEEIASKSASSLRIAHSASRSALVRHYRGLISDMERSYLDELMKTHDANEGIQAFLEKRSPVWADH